MPSLIWTKGRLVRGRKWLAITCYQRIVLVSYEYYCLNFVNGLCVIPR